MTITATPRRVMDLTAAGLIEPGDVLVAWSDGTLAEATQFLNVQRYPDHIVWRTVVAVDEVGPQVLVTFSDSPTPVTLPADDDVVALTTLPAKVHLVVGPLNGVGVRAGGWIACDPAEVRPNPPLTQRTRNQVKATCPDCLSTAATA